MTSMGKEANIAKVHFLMKEKGMSAKEAIKAAYPEWSDEKVAALAAKLSGMKDAGMGKAKKEAPAEEKKASVEKMERLGFKDSQRALMRGLSSGKPSDQSLIASKDTIKRRLKAHGKGALVGAPIGALAGLALAPKGGRALGAALLGAVSAGVGGIVGQTRSDQKFLKSKGIDMKWHGLSVKITPKARAKYFPEHKSLTDKTAGVKLAKLRVHDIEDEIGDYLSDADETKVRRMITKAKKKSFAMRHPILTGIPTLGIAPAMANNKAKMKIIRQLAKSDPKMRKQLRKMRETKRREDHEMAVARAGRTNVTVNEKSKESSVKLAQNAFTAPKKTHTPIKPAPTRKTPSYPNIGSAIRSAAKLNRPPSISASLLPRPFKPVDPNRRSLGEAIQGSGWGARNDTLLKREQEGRRWQLQQRIDRERKMLEQQQQQQGFKTASVQLVALQRGSEALYEGYIQKHAVLNPVTTAKVSKFFKGLMTKAKPAAKAAGETVKGWGSALATKFPGATKKAKDAIAEFVKNNPKAAKAIKENWKPAAGGAAAGAIISKAMSD